MYLFEIRLREQLHPRPARKSHAHKCVLCGSWTLTLLDGSQPTFEKRGAPIGLILESLRPKSYSRESFAGPKAHPLDAAHIAPGKGFVGTSMHEHGIPV